MEESSDDLRERLQDQLDLAAGLCRLTMTYGEQVATLSNEALQKWVRQADHDAEALLQGDFSVFPEKGRIAVDHWTALLSCTLEFQKAFLAAFPTRD
ncbi:hypothetical protein [Zoogloea sp.]|uniref:hypothetical protein n=1 Tax=Zoogloea sp. TaxID=49181 RepID=UPI0035B12705